MKISYCIPIEYEQLIYSLFQVFLCNMNNYVVFIN